MNLDQFLPEPVAIVGYGVEGRSTASFLRERGIAFRILDHNSALDFPSDMDVFSGEGFLTGLDGCKSAVRSAGIRPDLPAFRNFVEAGGLLTSQIELFLDLNCAPVVGVTGTFGKGSCVSIAGHVLEKLAKPCRIGGNIGLPALELFRGNDLESPVLLELSSFQLMSQSCSPGIAVVLAVTSEHLDWHKNTEEYRRAKAALVKFQSKEDCCIFFADSEGSNEIAGQSPARKLSFGKEGEARIRGKALWFDGIELKLGDCALRGNFQLQNMAAAALLLRELGVSAKESLSAMKSFPGLQYRLQLSGVVSGVACYNDSYATRPEATMGALASFDERLSLILGGSEKNADFGELVRSLHSNSNLYSIALIGETAARLEKELRAFASPTFDLEKHESLEAAVDSSLRILQGEGVLLLSPACASFGLFRNYKDRGASFDRIITRLVPGSKE